MGLEKRGNKLWFFEELYSDVSQGFEVTKVLYEEMSKDAHGNPLQDLKVLDTPHHGKVLIIDRVVQVTEIDNFYYHEPIVHCVVNSCLRPPKTALLIGCDGGVLREIVKYKSLEKIEVVDIDRKVIDLMLKFIPSIPGKAFSDPRVKLTIIDGFDYVRDKIKEKKKYDVIVVDSPDPIGAAKSLFRKEFYTDLAQILNLGGIIVRQTGVTSFQPEEMPENYRSFKEAFPDGEVQGLVSAVPTYYGGYFTFLAVSNQKGIFQAALKDLDKRVQQLDLKGLKWYSSEMHRAALILPAGIQRSLK